jgi:HEAT repeat protein
MAGDKEWRVRLSAVQALGDLADPGAVPQLRRSLEDPEWIVREWAARGLESVTGERATYRNQRGEQVVPYSLYR